MFLGNGLMESGSVSWTWSELISVTVIALEHLGSRELVNDTYKLLNGKNFKGLLWYINPSYFQS